MLLRSTYGASDVRLDTQRKRTQKVGLARRVHLRSHHHFEPNRNPPPLPSTQPSNLVIAYSQTIGKGEERAPASRQRQQADSKQAPE